MTCAYYIIITWMSRSHTRATFAKTQNRHSRSKFNFGLNLVLLLQVVVSPTELENELRPKMYIHDKWLIIYDSSSTYFWSSISEKIKFWNVFGLKWPDFKKNGLFKLKSILTLNDLLRFRFVFWEIRYALAWFKFERKLLK